MSFRSYVKVARPAEHNSTFTKQRNVTGVEGGSGEPGVPGPEGPQGPPGEDGKDGVVDPSKLNIVFNTDQIELVDVDGNFCGLHVKGVNGITVSEDDTYGNQSMVIGLPDGFSGEIGKESTPYVDWHQFKVIERSTRFDYDPLFDTNPIATTEWEYQIDLTGAGGFAKVEDIPENILLSIGWYATPTVSHLRLNKTEEQMGTYPDAMVRFRVFTSLNGVDNEEFSCSLPAWQNGGCDYESSVSSLATRVEEGEDKQDEVVAAIQQIQVQGAQWALHVENIDADQIEQNNAIESLQNEVEELATQRGAAREYTVKGVSYNVASRDGELYLSSTTAADINVISIGIRDINGNETPPVDVGDILDLEVEGEINRYTVTNGNITGLELSYQSGESTFAVDQNVRVYIYPQNSSSASKEYVDAQDSALKDYIDTEIDNLDSTTLMWKRVSKGAEDLQIGEFYISSANHNIYLHPKAIGGVDLNMEPRVDKVTGIKHLVSVHKFNGTINYSIVCTEIAFNVGSNNYIRLTSSSVLCEDYTSIDQNCRINIPGFTF
jgi:hypothetical protein